MWVRFLGWDDPLEGEMATHSSILAWRIPWIEEPSAPQAMGRKEWDTTEQRTLFLYHYHHLGSNLESCCD